MCLTHQEHQIYKVFLKKIKNQTTKLENEQFLFHLSYHNLFIKHQKRVKEKTEERNKLFFKNSPLRAPF